MSDDQHPDRFQHRVERIYEVIATPEEVWDAIATADGISSWMRVPTRIDDPEVGGVVSFDFGSFRSDGAITAYEPGRRFAYEEPWPPVGGHDWSEVSPIATELLIESASGGSAVLRVVTSAYGTGADWEREYFDEMVEGWVEMLDRLAARLGGTVRA